MAGSITLCTSTTTSFRKTVSTKPQLFQTQRSPLVKQPPDSFTSRIGTLNYCRIRSTRLFAGFSEIEPDLNEDPVDRWRTNGIAPEDFVYGKYDDHHTYYETDEKVSFWESIAEDYAAIGPPTGFQGLISWLFLPSIAAGLYFNVPGEYLYIGAAVFTVVFCIIEMDKPSEPHNFEPQIYNMERGARDKLIADYNTMDIWDFNEKYGDIWDFTIKKDSAEIMKR